MKKDTYYFSHDANSRNDVKCIKLRRELGLEGYGIFWCLIEILREAPENKLLLTALEDIAYDLHTSKEKLEAVVLRYDLFKLEEDKFFSERLTRSMSAWNDHKQKLSESGSKGNLIRWGSGGDRKAITKQSQLKERKVNKRKKKLESADAPAKSFKQWDDKEFYEEIAKFKDDYPKDTLRAFYNYWSEKNAGGKMAFQLKDTWETKKRLVTWSSRDSKFEKKDDKNTPVVKLEKVPTRFKNITGTA
jgi:hypothetical protein